MEKLKIFPFLILTSLSLNYTQAQCDFRKDFSALEIFTQDLIAKAQVIAAMDDTIEERIDAKTGRKYYVRQFISPWSGEPGYSFITFNTDLEAFVEHHTISFLDINGNEEGKDTTAKGAQTSGCEQRDSIQMQQRKLLPENIAPANRQPRRSSRVKLASLF